MVHDDESKKAEETVAEILADAGYRLLSKAVSAAKKFTRKKWPREQKLDLASYGKTHIPLADGVCVVCHTRDAIRTELCPGPDAARKAAEELRRESGRR